MSFTRTVKRTIQSIPLAPLGADAVRFFREPRIQRDIWRDYFRTRKDAAFLRTAKLPPPNGKTALIGSLGNSVNQLKLESMLGLGLRLAGWRVIPLLRHRQDRWPRRYFRAFGIDDFAYWEDFTASPEESEACAAEARQRLAGNLDFRAVKQWTYRNSWIGPHVLSWISRGMFDGAPDPANPEVRERLVKLLPATFERVHVAEHIFDRLRPDLVFLNEPNYADNGPLTDTAVNRGIDFIHVAQIDRDDALMLRRLNKSTRREHPSSISKETLDRLQAEPWTDKEERELAEEFEARYAGKRELQTRYQPGTERCDRAELFKRLQLDPAKKVAVVFSHVLWDANLFYGEDLCENYGDWFVQTVRAATQNSRTNWLLKLHPVNLWKRRLLGLENEMSELTLIRKHIGELPAHVRLLMPDFPISNRSLFDITDYGITVRGTIGSELPCFGVPVFTAGTGRCHGHGFTIDSRTRDEYLDRMARIQEQAALTPEQILRAKRYALAAFRRRPWRIKTFRGEFFTPKKGKHPLEHNMHLTAHSLEAIRANGDLDRWARWAAHPDLVDYMEY